MGPSGARQTLGVQRIAIVGPVASGKTTLARSISSTLGLPLIDLDDLYWRRLPVPNEAEWAEIHEAAIVRDAWVIAGDYRAVARSRFVRAEVVVWLDLPRWVCIARAVRRHISGYPGRLYDCVRWIWRYPGQGRHETDDLLAQMVELKVYRVRHRSDLRRLDLMTSTPPGS